MVVLSRLALFAVASVASAASFGQSLWVPTGMPGQIVGLLRHIHASPAKDTIYLAGMISLNQALPWQQSNSVMRYSNGAWDTLGVLNAQVLTVVQYRDTLVAGGLLLQCSGTPCSGASYWDGFAWQPFGNFGSGTVRMLRVLDGELYAVGSFDEVDGQPASGVALRVGSGWVPVGTMDSEGLLDIAKYNGKLVVIGNVDFPTGRRIAQWDGTDWSLLGPGIIDGFSSAQCLVVYQGDLYVGGQIRMAPPGNPGQNIMRWDGTQFHALGQGVQWWLGDTQSTATVMEMVEHDGKLFVGGGYRAAGGIEALGLATWDGVEWCAVPGDFRASGGIWGMDFYQDTLFVACGTTLDGEIVNGTAKFIGEQYESECSGPVGVGGPIPVAGAQVLPNPGHEFCNVTLRGNQRAIVQVSDALGRSVWTLSVSGGVSMNTVDWPPGTYIITITTSDGARQVLRWVKQ